MGGTPDDLYGGTTDAYLKRVRSSYVSVATPCIILREVGAASRPAGE